jgi:hypothetical protein
MTFTKRHARKLIAFLDSPMVKRALDRQVVYSFLLFLREQDRPLFDWLLPWMEVRGLSRSMFDEDYCVSSGDAAECAANFGRCIEFLDRWETMVAAHRFPERAAPLKEFRERHSIAVFTSPTELREQFVLLRMWANDR